MRVISLVPSWTETLIACDVNVVGRTRFCIHPKAAHGIPVVGGTKDLDWEKVRALKPDVILVDREENLEWMKTEAPCKVVDTHVTTLADVVVYLSYLAKIFHSRHLELLANRWSRVVDAPNNIWDWGRIPGVVEHLNLAAKDSANVERDRAIGIGDVANIGPDREGDDGKDFSHLAYVIWKKPWMTVSRQTFIGDVLAKLGAEKFLISNAEKYPKFETLSEFPEKTFFLFSSEPFPFHKKIEDLRRDGFRGAVVDGEPYSWFGVRSLEFLERELRIGNHTGFPR